MHKNTNISNVTWIVPHTDNKLVPVQTETAQQANRVLDVGLICGKSAKITWWMVKNISASDIFPVIAKEKMDDYTFMLHTDTKINAHGEVGLWISPKDAKLEMRPSAIGYVDKTGSVRFFEHIWLDALQKSFITEQVHRFKIT